MMDPIIEQELSIEFHSFDSSEEERRNTKIMTDRFGSLLENRQEEQEQMCVSSDEEEEEEEDLFGGLDIQSCIAQAISNVGQETKTQETKTQETNVVGTKVEKTKTIGKKRKGERKEKQTDALDIRSILKSNYTWFIKWLLYRAYFEEEEIEPPNPETDSPELIHDKEQYALMWFGFDQFVKSLAVHQNNMYTTFRTLMLQQLHGDESHPMVVFYAAMKHYRELHTRLLKASPTNTQDSMVLDVWTGEQFQPREAHERGDNRRMLIIHPLRTDVNQEEVDEEDLQAWEQGLLEIEEEKGWRRPIALPEAFSVCMIKDAADTMQYHHNIFHMMHYVVKQMYSFLPQPEEMENKRFHEIWQMLTDNMANTDAMDWPISRGATSFVRMFSEWREKLFHSFDLF